MSLHLRPVGPLPESAYWRRRAGVLGGLLLVLLLLSRCGADDDARLEQETPATAPTAAAAPPPAASTAPSPDPSADPSAGPSAAPTTSAATTPEPTAAGPVACTDASLRIAATTQRAAYPSGGRPVLRLAVRNAGPVPCVRPLGQGAVTLVVSSGRDRIWSSDDCAPGGPAGPVVLRPQELRVITLTWAARRSRPGCPGGAEAAQPGTYRVAGRVGTLTSEGASFRIVG